MKKAYLIAPLVGLGLFATAYAFHTRDYAARQSAHARRLEETRQKRFAAEAVARKCAYDEAAAAREKRALARAEEAARAAAEKDARLTAEQQRERAAHDEKQAQRRLDALQRKLTAVEAALARTARETEALQDENTHLLAWTEQTEANRRSLFALLDQLDAVERVRARLESAGKKPRGSSPL